MYLREVYKWLWQHQELCTRWACPNRLTDKADDFTAETFSVEIKRQTGIGEDDVMCTNTFAIRQQGACAWWYGTVRKQMWADDTEVGVVHGTPRVVPRGTESICEIVVIHHHEVDTVTHDKVLGRFGVRLVDEFEVPQAGQ